MKSILFAAALVLTAGSATAHEYKAGSIEIKHPWARATPKGSEVAGGYMKLINTGKEPDRLIGGSVPIAGKFEIHEMSMDGGVMKMRMQPKGIEIKPGQTVEFKPGSYHLMFVGLKEPFEKGKCTCKGAQDCLAMGKAGVCDPKGPVSCPKGSDECTCDWKQKRLQ